MSVHDAVAWYSMFVCMVFDALFLGLPVLAELRGSILWILLVLSVSHTLVCGALNTARAGSMSSTSTEGPNTASTGSMISTEPRVQHAVPAVQTSEILCSNQSIQSILNPEIRRVLVIYSRTKYYY